MRVRVRVGCWRADLWCVRAGDFVSRAGGACLRRACRARNARACVGPAPQVEWVKALHPDCATYADVYKNHGLLHDRSYMAHCVHCRAEGEVCIPSFLTILLFLTPFHFFLSSVLPFFLPSFLHSFLASIRL